MNMIFIVGAPRSGTTWLQLLLSQHPSIATCQETHFFSGYMRPLFRRWENEQRDSGERKIGLKSIITRDNFLDMCRSSSDYLFEHIAATKPGSTWVLEKTPIHIRYTHIIRELYPDARFIHMVRDPRSVAASLTAASGDWGKSWQGGGIIEFAKLWSHSVSLGASLMQAIPTMTKELKYEDLSSSSSEELQKLLLWLDLPSELSFCEQAVTNCDLSKLKKSKDTLNTASSPWSIEGEPKSFFRKGSIDGWKSELKPHEVLAIEKIAEKQMCRYSYESQRSATPLDACVANTAMAYHNLLIRARRMFSREHH